jgi:hypothetical protein
MIGATGLILYVIASMIGIVDMALEPNEFTIYTHVSQGGQLVGGALLLYSVCALLVRYAP